MSSLKITAGLLTFNSLRFKSLKDLEQTQLQTTMVNIKCYHNRNHMPLSFIVPMATHGARICPHRILKTVRCKKYEEKTLCPFLEGRIL